jgi:hypothetical protein
MPDSTPSRLKPWATHAGATVVAHEDNRRRVPDQNRDSYGADTSSRLTDMAAPGFAGLGHGTHGDTLEIGTADTAVAHDDDRCRVPDQNRDSYGADTSVDSTTAGIDSYRRH